MALSLVNGEASCGGNDIHFKGRAYPTASDEDSGHRHDAGLGASSSSSSFFA